MGSINTFYIIRHDVMGSETLFMSYQTSSDIKSLEKIPYAVGYVLKSLEFIEYVAPYDIKSLEKMSYIVTYDIFSRLFICILILGL